MIRHSKRNGWRYWNYVLFLGFIPLISAAIFFFILKNLGYPVLGILLFIITLTLGLPTFFVYLFQRKELSLQQFLFSVGALIILTIVIFGVVFTMEGSGENIMIDNGVPKQLTLADGLYFSADTITTLGRGDIVPRGYFRMFTILEVILGLFYLGLFIAGVGHIYDKE